MTRWSRILSALVIGVLAAACSDFSYISSEAHLRYDDKTDELVLIDIEHGVFATSKQAHAATAVQNIAAGQRVYPPERGLITLIDVDAMEDKLRDKPAAAWNDVDRKTDEFARGVKVEKSGVFLDEDGRLSLFQSWRIAKLHLGLELANRTINEGIAEQPDSLQPDGQWLDQTTCDLVRARSKTGAAWLRTEGDALVIDMPASPECAKRIAAALRDAQTSETGTTSVLQQPSSVEIKDQQAILRYAPGADGWIHLECGGVGPPYAPNILEQLKADGSFVDAAATVRELRGAMKTR